MSVEHIISCNVTHASYQGLQRPVCKIIWWLQYVWPNTNSVENRIGLDQQYAALAALARNRSQTDRSIDTTASACSAASIFFFIFGRQSTAASRIATSCCTAQFSASQGQDSANKVSRPGNLAFTSGLESVMVAIQSLSGAWWSIAPVQQRWWCHWKTACFAMQLFALSTTSIPPSCLLWLHICIFVSSEGIRIHS